MPRASYYDRHPEVPERSEGLEGRRPVSRHRARAAHPSRLAYARTSGLRSLNVWAHPAHCLAFFRSPLFSSSHHLRFLPSSHHLTFPRGVRRVDRLVSLCRPRNEGGGGAPQGAHWVFDHAGEARCRVNGTRRSRCDRDRAPRRSTVAISGRGTTLQLRQCPPDPRCDLPAGPIARPGRLGPVPPAPGFASTSHGTPRLAPSGGSSPETPLMSENESCVA
jgi:hypothetical protein